MNETFLNSIGVSVVAVILCPLFPKVFVAKKSTKCDQMPQIDLGCITAHPGFNSICLDVWVLQTAYYTYRQQHGSLNEEFTNEYVHVSCLGHKHG